MSTIKITDDNRETTTSLLNSYSLEPLEEGLILELNLPNSFIKYLFQPPIVISIIAKLSFLICILGI